MQREYRIDNLRAVAILLVMLGHAIIIYDPNWTVAATKVQCQPLYYLKQLINIIQMPLFFSISGFCFCLSRHQSFSRELFWGKFKRIMIPYFLVCLLYMDPIKMLLQVPGYDSTWKLPLKQLCLFMDNGHLWYLPTLFLMFVVTSFSLGKKGGMKPVYALSLFSIVLFALSGRVPAYFSLNQFSSFYVYFLGGYIICHYKEKVFGKCVAGLVMLAVSMALGLLLDDIGSGAVEKGASLALSSCAVVGAYCLAASRKIGFLQQVSKDSYGLYLFHSPLIYFMFMKWPDAHPALMLGVNFLVCGLVGWGMVRAVRKLGLGIVIGENQPSKMKQEAS